MKLKLSLGILLGGVSAFADIGLLYSSNLKVVFFRDGARVRAVECKTLPINRTCAARSEYRSASYESYVHSARSFYHVPNRWNYLEGKKGMKVENELNHSLENLQKIVDDASTTSAEQSLAKAKIKSLQSIQERVLKAKDEFLKYLESGVDRLLEEDIHAKAFDRTIAALKPIWFDDSSQVYHLGSRASSFKDTKKVCGARHWEWATPAPGAGAFFGITEIWDQNHQFDFPSYAPLTRPLWHFGEVFHHASPRNLHHSLYHYDYPTKSYISAYSWRDIDSFAPVICRWTADSTSDPDPIPEPNPAPPKIPEKKDDAFKKEKLPFEIE